MALSQAQWQRPVIPALWRILPQQEGGELKDSLDNIVRLYLKKKSVS
jgi:hypothetical protein